MASQECRFMWRQRLLPASCRQVADRAFKAVRGEVPSELGFAAFLLVTALIIAMQIQQSKDNDPNRRLAQPSCSLREFRSRKGNDRLGLGGAA